MLPYDVCLSLTSFTLIISRSIHVTANGINTFFLWLSNIPLCIYTVFKGLILIKCLLLTLMSCFWKCLSTPSIIGVILHILWRYVSNNLSKHCVILNIHIYIHTYILYYVSLTRACGYQCRERPKKWTHKWTTAFRYFSLIDKICRKGAFAFVKLSLGYKAKHWWFNDPPVPPI